ncbi:hypothetical protein CDAR_54031 [Caerostris darwini]|uniref:Uncharacterized protein n=1 Tax=Caerostris darwini TaxID=1538125 RepID=A0AAV4WEI1_9ARAC|nr:hypothetical protein CDAR_54031 [Caerostris darwini]
MVYLISQIAPFHCMRYLPYVQYGTDISSSEEILPAISRGANKRNTYRQGYFICPRSNITRSDFCLGIRKFIATARLGKNTIYTNMTIAPVSTFDRFGAIPFSAGI